MNTLLRACETSAPDLDTASPGGCFRPGARQARPRRSDSGRSHGEEDAVLTVSTCSRLRKHSVGVGA